MRRNAVGAPRHAVGAPRPLVFSRRLAEVRLGMMQQSCTELLRHCKLSYVLPMLPH